VNYRDVVEILKVSQDRPARDERFDTFKRAVSFYGVQPTSEVILVAGTNGKGTVSATLAKLLGGNVGLFTSPHLIEPTERISTNGRDLEPSELVRAYELIEETVRKFDLSHFEILTLMMIEVFWGGRIRPPVDHAVVEVGVGGRLDPTRVIPHSTAVIARIGMDHEAILGHTLSAIAREKLAIAEDAERLIYMKPQSELQSVFDEARSLYAPCEFIEALPFDSAVGREPGSGVPVWSVQTPWGEAPLALKGARAVENTSLALEVMNALGAPIELNRLREVKWPGRMECIRERVYFSGDHNEQGVESLREILAHFDYETLWLVVGIGKGKPAEAMLEHYRKIPRAKIILTKTYFRQISDPEFAQLNGDLKIDDAYEALQQALAQAKPKDLVVVSGSLYLVGDLKRLMSERSR